jgi:hypothetical protein
MPSFGDGDSMTDPWWLFDGTAPPFGADGFHETWYIESRPHQGIGQRVPTKPVLDIDLSKPIEVSSMLGGLHVDYRRAA